MALRDDVIDRIRGDAHHPVRRLDRWLLAILVDVGASTAADIVGSRRYQEGRAGENDPELTARQTRRWLQSAKQRGLVEIQSTDLDGEPLNPPEWRISAAGRARLKKVTGLRAMSVDIVSFITGAPNGWRDAVQHIREEDVPAFGPPPPSRPHLPAITRNPGDHLSAEQALENLEKIDHIVVLMMENRSFDQMLGYLDDGRNDIAGIRGAKPNEYEGQTYAPKRLVRTRMPKSLDPPHGANAIAEQINQGAMDGFARAFMKATDGADVDMVMGYYTYDELPVYDYLAQAFCVCDRWFSSVPGATWPNRLYSLTGKSVKHREGLFDGGVFYDLPSFVRQLPDQTAETGWRWYSTDPATLRLIDSDYRLDVQADFHHENFRRVEKYALDPGYEIVDNEMVLKVGSGFLTDCAQGNLAKVSWIDPNFVDLSILDPTSDDDHPPSDVLAGQELVLRVFRALTESGLWAKTLFVITYDEHGGFYDHVAPDESPEPDPQFATYGVRVPALVVSPLVEPHTVSKLTYDHTSLIRTILARFAPGRIDDMPRRVGMAEHLGRLLTRDPSEAGPPPGYGSVLDELEAWTLRHAEEQAPSSEQVTDPGAPPPIRGFPAEILEGGRRLREQGLPAGHP